MAGTLSRKPAGVGELVSPDRTYRSGARPATTRPLVNPRRPPLRPTLDALSQAFVDAVLLAVRRTPLAELAGALDLARSRANPRPVAPEAVRAPRRSEAAPSSAPARFRRANRAPPAAPRYQLELPLDPSNAYPEVAIVDPAAVLGGLQPLENAPGAPIVPADKAQSLPTSPPAPAPVSPSPPAASSPPLRPGEDILRAAGGGLVLRRRRSPPSPSNSP